MSKIRKLLIGLGVIATVPALAYAATRTGERPGCGEIQPSATATTQAAEHTITCPITGEQVQESECPLCRGEK